MYSPTFKRTALLLSMAVASWAAAVVPDTVHAADPIDANQAATASQTSVDAARFTDAGELLRPANLDEWVFLGSSLGMGYDNADFDPQSPGNFQVVLMEPGAYAYLKRNGKYANGSMFLLSIYATQRRVSIDRAGFAQGELKNFEIHLVDRNRFAEGHAFYLFGKDDDQAKVLPAGNPCVECHVQHGAYDGTFVQFYPAIRHKIPIDLLNKSLSDRPQQH